MPHTEARLLVTTGKPVQPHGYEGLEGLTGVNYRWVRVAPGLFTDFGFDTTSDTVCGFCENFAADRPTQDTARIMFIRTAAAFSHLHYALPLYV